EFMQHWYDKHGIPLRTLLIAYIAKINKLGSFVPSFFNFCIQNKFISGVVKKVIGFAPQRSIPSLYKTTLRKWVRKNLESVNPEKPQGTVCLFVDEFSDFNDTETGIAAIRLLTSAGYKIITVNHCVSARTFISKGLIRKAKKIVRKNIIALSGTISSDIPLVGIEPSAILGFRDEYPDLAGDDLKEVARKIAENSYMIDEFIAREYRSGKIDRGLFTDDSREILLHAHCQQKAIASSESSIEMLSIPANYKVKEIPSGCCGMAGSFGYEKEHFELSNEIGELVLFPEVRGAGEDVIIAAPGTSCRSHIKEGTGRTALHPVEIMYRALKRQASND
ncbi:MAG: FAD-binding oxidoreductase, partial [Bacteroidales bacterium]|nr:FAD-binding oxidoreductase [Bacteroidales bacterium]